MEIRKNSWQVILVTLQEYNGQPICSVRLWFEAEAVLAAAEQSRKAPEQVRVVDGRAARAASSGRSP